MTAIVASHQPTSEEALIANMKTLMVTIGDLKADMLRMLEEDAGRASCFRATRAETARLAEAVSELEDRLGRVIDRARGETLPEVDARLAEYPKVLEQLRAAELVHQAMSVISDIQCRMAALQVSVKQGRYLDCVDQVVALDDLFRRDLQLVKEDVQVLSLLRNLYITCKHSLHDAFLAMWSDNFVFKDRLEKPLVCSLCVGNLSEAPRLVRAFQALKLFHSKVDAQLADTLMNRFLLPVIADASLVVECNLVNNQLELVLVDTQHQGGAEKGQRQPPSPVALCAVLEPVLATLWDRLLSLPLGGESSDDTLADRLRPLVEERLADGLIVDCLAKTVPAHWDGLLTYGETATAIESLERQLVSDCRLLSPTVSRLGAFVRDIAGVFADKRVAAVLEAGRAIAAGPLADSVTVGGEDGGSPGGDGESGGGGEEAALVEKYIDKRAFAFPLCRVSRSAVDLLAYIGRVCGEADGYGRGRGDGDANANASVDLFAAELRCRVGLCCRKLLALYRVTAASVHAEQLAAVPQLAALYYNSCHYLAYCSVDIEHRFVGPLVSGRQPAPPKCLVDAAASLRADGARVFLAQLAAQRALVLEPVSQLTLGQQSTGGSYDANSRLCRQSCHQLECLGRVWSVLPAKIHGKSLGSLGHSLMSALIAFALSQEDFDCRDADDLARIFQGVQESVAQAFASAADAPSPERFAPCWQRFCLLGQMLAAPLAAFPDLWCDGKSPLAAAFTDAEVRGLVKALFTNTDDRAAVLAKIK